MQSSRQQRDHHTQQARSPPSAAKNLQHVPCRFYRSGQCTAGRNCVFSHDLQQETERAPCKYFQKGNCRFGAKCALAHILPDGRRVNHNHRGSGQVPVFGRIVPENRSFQSSGIHDQLIQSQHTQSITSPESAALESHMDKLRLADKHDAPPLPQHVTEWQESQNNTFAGQPEGLGRSDTSQPSRPRASQDYTSRSPQSPPGRALGPLDAQLPASLDSNGVSWFARHGPVAASVPHTRQFGIPEQFTSHPPSPLPASTVQPSTSLFTSNLGTSPRNSALGRVMFERRASAINDRGDDHDLVFEEDFVPSSLNELLTPAERQRRDSRGADEHFSKSPTGSAPASPSSSRFGLLFSKHKAAETNLRHSPSNQASLLPIGSPLARSSGLTADQVMSPPRLYRTGSNLRTDMRPSAKEFSVAKEKEFKSEDEPFEMDI